MVRFSFVVVIILIMLTGCQTTLVASPPQVDTLPTSPPTPGDLPPTPAARSIPTRELTVAPTTGVLLTETPLIQPDAEMLPRSSPAASLPPDMILVGRSVEGRDIIARRIGSGARVLLLVGGIHGGWEDNTVTLIHELIAHFEANPDDILPGMALMFVPVANPDGIPHGRAEAGRFNANGVDLNRNWGCEWSADARWRDQSVNAGDEPFSEPETRALSAFIQNLQPVTVLFYHSAAGGVYAGNCEGDHGSALMSQILGQATGYSYGQAFSAYRVTGTAASWVDGLGIPSADVELFSWYDSEFARNLAGIMALQEWLAG